jgi:hypothetical protein
MKTLISIGSIALGSIALNLIPVQQAQAAILQNGDFTPATATTGVVSFGGYGQNDTTTIPNWTSKGYNFLISSGTGLSIPNNLDGNDSNGNPQSVNFYGSSLTAPNGAGYYIAADSAYLSGAIYQQLNDLEVGQTYLIDYYQSAAQQVNYSGGTTDAWIANVGGAYVPPTYDGDGANTSTGGFTGGTTHESPTMSLGSQAAAGTQTTTTGNPNVNGWHQDSFAFTATNTTETLSFLAKGGPSGKPPFALLSGVSASKIPEPDTYVGTLLGLGIVGTVVKSRLTKKKLEDRN